MPPEPHQIVAATTAVQQEQHKTPEHNLDSYDDFLVANVILKWMFNSEQIVQF